MAEEHQIELSPVIKAGDVIHSAKRLQSVIKEALDASAGRELNSQLIGIKGNIEKITLKTEATVQAIEKEKAEFERLGQEMDKQEERVDRANSELRKQEAILNKMVKEQAERSPDSYSYEHAQEEIDAQQKLVDIVSNRLEMERKERDRIDAQQMKSEENLTKLINQQEQLNNQTRIYGEKWNYVLAQQDEAGENAGVAQQRKDMMNLNKGIMGVTTSVRSLGMLIPGVSTKGFRAVSMLTRSVVKLSSLTKEQLVAGIEVLKKTAMSALNAIASHPIVAIILAAVAVITYAIKKLVDQTKKDVELIVKAVKNGLQTAVRLFQKFIVTLTKSFVGLGLLVSKTIVGFLAKIANELLSLKGVITENLKLMAKWRDGNNAVNVALSNLTSSLANLKAALASAFAPILTTIEPILTRLIDKLAEAITMIGMFIAKLSGATTFQKAIRVQKDYAKALDKTGSAAKKALGPLDNLNVITSQQGGGAGGEAVDWEEITLKDFELPDWLKDLYELGTTVGLKIRDFLNSIPWDSVKEGAEKAAQGIADFINGMLSVRDLGKAVGYALGELLNTFIIFVNTLLTKIHFDKLGEQVGGAIAEAISTIEWGDFGAIFANALNALATFLYRMALKVDGTELGKGFAEMIANALGRIDWNTIHQALSELAWDLASMLNAVLTPETFSALGETIAKALNEAFHTVGEFTHRAHWKDWGKNISTGINKMIDTFDAKGAGKTVSDLALGLLDMILEAVENIDWDQVADKLVEFLSNIDWERIGQKAQEISEKLADGLDKVWTALEESGTLDRIIDCIVDFLNEKKHWEKAFDRLKKKIFWEVFLEKLTRIPDDVAKWFEDIGKDIIKGILGGMTFTSDADILTTVKAVFGTIWGALCGVFLIHSPAKSMMPIGENIVLGILEGFGLVDFIQKVTEWWNTNVTPWFTSIQENIDIMKEAIALKVDAIKNKLIDTFRAIKNGIKIPINGIIAMVEGLVNKIIDGVNWLVDKLNSLPDLEITNPFTGAEYSLGISLPKLTPIQIPRLAQGAVIPPNREFVAMLGDQKQGTNIEAPLDTIKQALAEVMAEMGGSDSQEIVINIDGREVMKALVKQNNEYKKQHNGASALA